ncbi:DUF2721 domain-containing protein [Oceanicoccus sp. KOV_DT_Chl]|uniref:DUF2721 domain-containing protein n=1 Tax=Oceanicoccus sp. KOV_DT_Chl TaxID=1904639 RepID=UPI000C7E7724|nr:DUF2721 domain-containing protein [Oceanicoccus sp. KOV_DT_Chl]
MGTILSDATTIGQVIQLAVAPVFLLAGISGLLMVMTNRLARIIDRSRILQRGLKGVIDVKSKEQIDKEMYQLSKRGHFINIAINMAACSALLVCLVIITLFLSKLAGTNLSTAIALLFILCMTLLIIALWMFIMEVFIATHAMRKGLMRSEILIMDFTRRDDY